MVCIKHGSVKIHNLYNTTAIGMNHKLQQVGKIFLSKNI